MDEPNNTNLTLLSSSPAGPIKKSHRLAIALLLVVAVVVSIVVITNFSLLSAAFTPKHQIVSLTYVNLTSITVSGTLGTQPVDYSQHGFNAASNSTSSFYWNLSDYDGGGTFLLEYIDPETSGFSVINTTPKLPYNITNGSELNLKIYIRNPQTAYSGPLDFKPVGTVLRPANSSPTKNSSNVSGSVKNINMTKISLTISFIQTDGSISSGITTSRGGLYRNASTFPYEITLTDNWTSSYQVTEIVSNSANFSVVNENYSLPLRVNPGAKTAVEITVETPTTPYTGPLYILVEEHELKGVPCANFTFSEDTASTSKSAECTWNGGNLTVVSNEGNFEGISTWVNSTAPSKNIYTLHETQNGKSCITETESHYFPPNTYEVYLKTNATGASCSNSGAFVELMPSS